MLGGVLVVCAVSAALVALAWLTQRQLVYFPAAGPVSPAATVLPGARDVELRTSDGLALGAWLIPAEEPSRGVSVLMANGNGGDRSLRAPLARALSERGLTVLLFDYRGYGGNPGSPSEDGLARDVRAARSFLVQNHGEDRLLYLGESLGTAVVTELAAEHPPDAMLLRSPFPDLASLAQVHYRVVPGWFLRDRFPLVEHLRTVRVPVTVVLGQEDSIVPPSESRAVAEAAPRLHRLVEVPSADHNSAALLDGDALVEAVEDLADLVAPRQ